MSVGCDAEDVIRYYLEGTSGRVAREAVEVVGMDGAAVGFGIDIGNREIAPVPRFVFVASAVWIVRVWHKKTVLSGMRLQPSESFLEMWSIPILIFG